MKQLISKSFKTLDDGRTFFFPTEGFGRPAGRLVPDQATKNRIIRAHSEYFVSVFVIAIIAAILVWLSRIIYLLLVALPVFTLFWFRFRCCYKDLEQHKNIRLHISGNVVIHSPWSHKKRLTILSSVLAAVFIIAAYSIISNPLQKFSTERYWEEATISSVYDIPDAALGAGNRNGPVLMWAASVVQDPKIIEALLARGAEINERDKFSKATALSAAAYQNSEKNVMSTLIDNGAQVDIVLGRLKKTPLLLAAEQNTLEITALLIEHGANTKYVDVNSLTAADIARKFENAPVVDYYLQLQQASVEY